MGAVERLERRRRDRPAPAARASAVALAPVLAGARARGMADAFDLLALAAIFLDAEGVALHINARARKALGGALSVRAGRLEAVVRAEDEVLQRHIRAALAGEPDRRHPLLLAQRDSRPALSLRILTVSAGDETAQLLRAVVLVDCADPEGIRDLFPDRAAHGDAA